MAVLGGVLIGCSARVADVGPFQIEAALLYYSTETGTPMETSGIGLGGMYFFKSVHPGTAPLSEAFFLARVSALSVVVAALDGGAASSPSGPLEIDGTAYGVTGYCADKSFPLALEVSYTTDESDTTGAAGTLGIEMSFLDVQVSYFPRDNLELGLTYRNIDQQVTPAGGGPPIETDGSAFGFAGKWVHGFANGTAVNVEAEYTSKTEEEAGSPAKDVTAMELSSVFYVNQLLGFGVGYGSESGDVAADDSTTWKASIRWNLGTRLGGLLSYSDTSFEDHVVGEIKRVTASVGCRF